MQPKTLQLKSGLAWGLIALSGGAFAQSTVGELKEKGGSALSKTDFLELMPARMETQWPNRQGEETLLFSVDGKITGTGYHYSSRTESPASGTWRVEEDGKFCTSKSFAA